MGHGKFLASLSKEKAELFHTSMKQAHEKNESLHAQVKSLYADLSVITKAASFDEKAYISKSAEISNFQTTMHKRRREELIAEDESAILIALFSGGFEFLLQYQLIFDKL